MNWDQTAINLVPSSPLTMETKGKKRVEIAGLHDKRQITAVFCGTVEHHFLPLQLIYGGKTQCCHPVYDFPDNWCITNCENHWSNEETMIEYIQGIIVPNVEGVRQMLGKNDQAALAIFDNFRGQLTENAVEELEHYNIQSVLVPANCMVRPQPMDLSVNKSAKAFMRSQFTMWYAEEMLLLHQGAKSKDQQHQPCHQTEDDNRNDEVKYIETDEDEQN